ncbi:MAG TPA: hypothetical protein VFV33_27455 [Gemmatimonadaceae bacterium]|nr:hypothetical protein [Gemmatimonadaceae bacterium]
MLHLPIERLAELVDGGATPAEREHLGACASCTRELEAYGRLVAMAGDERRRIAPPLTEWDALGARLRAEGLVKAPAATLHGRPGARRGGALVEFARRAAAVLVLVGGGAVLGRMSAGMEVVDAVAFRAGAAPGAEATMRGPSDAGIAPANVLPAANAGGDFRTSQDALAALDLAQRQYEQAAAWLATHDTSSSEAAPEQYRTRLAALDRTAQTMQQAMRDAPSDPYINQYYLATLSAREQTLRRLGTTLPVGNKLGSF